MSFLKISNTGLTAAQLSAIGNIIAMVPDFHFNSAYAKESYIRTAIEIGDRGLGALRYYTHTEDHDELMRQLARYKGRDTTAPCGVCSAIDPIGDSIKNHIVITPNIY